MLLGTTLPPILPNSQSFPPYQSQVSSLHQWVYFCFCRYVHWCPILDPRINDTTIRCLSLSDLPSLGMGISRSIHIAANGSVPFSFRRLFQLVEKLPIFFPGWPCHLTPFPVMWEHSACSNSLTIACCKACFPVQDCCLFLLSCHFIIF